MSKIIFCAILLFAAAVFCKEEEDSSGKYQYMQIFRNIPRLFEYFLSRLAEKPEVLEKDDITVFIKNADLSGNQKEKVKRDTCPIEGNDDTEETMCPISKKSGNAKGDTEKPNIQKRTDEIIQNKQLKQNKTAQNKRNTDTKYEHCLSDADAISCKILKRDLINKSYEFNANIETPRKKYNISYGNTRDTVNLNEDINGLDKPNNALKKQKQHGYVKGKNDRKLEKKNKRRSAANDFKLFSFSAEEVEDKILMVEQMLEDHEKNSRKVK